jgi:hypothetical protein
VEQGPSLRVAFRPSALTPSHRILVPRKKNLTKDHIRDARIFQLGGAGTRFSSHRCAKSIRQI